MSTDAPRVLMREERAAHVPVMVAAPKTAWRALAWFGLLLALIGLADVALRWYPLGVGSPEWEFATISGSLGSLPLATMGLAAMLASFLARGVRAGIITLAIVLLVLALLVGAAYTLFVLDIPLALRAPAPASLAVRQAIARTSVMGLGFGVGYLAAAIAAFRFISRR
jgi:hypothetical protein